MEKILKEATLGFLIKQDKIMLAHKTRHIGAGCLNGYGGGIKEEETLLQALLRELEEESGVVADPDYIKKVAVLDMHNLTEQGETFVCRVHTFLVSSWEGEPVATSEMKEPNWFDIKELPVDRLMPADQAWLPRVLDGETLHVQAWYGPKQRVLLRPVEIEPLSDALL